VTLVALASRVAEREESVLLEHDPDDLGALLVERGDRLRERKPGHDEGQHRDAIAERVTRARAAVGLVGDRDDRVGVRVIDEAMRQERVEERLDARVRRARVEQMGSELIDHLLVGHSRERAEPAEVGEIDRGMIARLDDIEARPRAFHPEARHPLAEEGLGLPLRRGVSAAVEHELPLAPDQARRVDTERERLARCAPSCDRFARPRLRPSALHRARAVAESR
jgi:hypothetical protein